MEIAKKRVAELEGAQLDWAVAKALELIPIRHQPIEYFYWKENCADRSGPFCPSTDWSLGGPIIEHEQVSLTFCVHEPNRRITRNHNLWLASIGGNFENGKTLLIAAMRAFVASKLGDEVEVPV